MIKILPVKHFAQWGNGNGSPYYLPAEDSPPLSVHELEQLKSQIQVAIDIMELNLLKPTTDQEHHEHVSKFGHGAFVVGNFVIKRR